MARLDLFLRSSPHIVRFAGFESTTTRLQQAGWQIAVEEEFDFRQIRLLMMHRGTDLKMLAKNQSCDFHRIVRSGERMIFDIVHCSSRMGIRLDERTFNFKEIDAMPQYVNMEFKSIEDFGIFAAPLVRTEEIIIEPQSVAECLDLIRKMQAPELAAVRKRNAQRDNAVNQQSFHAQILSLAA